MDASDIRPAGLYAVPGGGNGGPVEPDHDDTDSVAKEAEDKFREWVKRLPLQSPLHLPFRRFRDGLARWTKGRGRRR
jgi:hypothetical protein